jgi:hypothetical protein
MASEQWRKYPVLASIEDMEPGDAIAQARARTQNTMDWAWGEPIELYRYSRAEYVVRAWSFETLYLLEPRSPCPGPEQFVFIGRSRRCDVCIPDDSVSRLHAAVAREYSSHHCCIQDVHSRHGVLVNGDRVPAEEMMSLSSGDLVSLGTRSLVFFEPSTLEMLAGIYR